MEPLVIWLKREVGWSRFSAPTQVTAIAGHWSILFDVGLVSLVKPLSSGPALHFEVGGGVKCRCQGLLCLLVMFPEEPIRKPPVSEFQSIPTPTSKKSSSSLKHLSLRIMSSSFGCLWHPRKGGCDLEDNFLQIDFLKCINRGHFWVE